MARATVVANAKALQDVAPKSTRYGVESYDPAVVVLSNQSSTKSWCNSVGASRGLAPT
jgi:hypothetical protein